MYLRLLVLGVMSIMTDSHDGSDDMRMADFKGFHVQGKMMVQKAPCLIGNCYGLPKISCIALNYKPSAILISYNGSHAIGCFLDQAAQLIDFKYFSGMWYYNDGNSFQHISFYSMQRYYCC